MLRAVKAQVAKTYRVFKSNCNEQNLYHAKTVRAFNVRIFSSCSKLAAVLYWVVVIILKVNDQFEIQDRT